MNGIVSYNTFPQSLLDESAELVPNEKDITFNVTVLNGTASTDRTMQFVFKI
ncbi:MAG: hypothetical protein GX682_00560 [Clostridiaceae bacterium]|nr:hypothetical protein [Clostridiaceae bacterium]